MRVLLDANVFISYLLTPDRESAPATILGRAFSGGFTVLLAQPLLDELARKVATKPYLARHILTDDLASLVDVLNVVAESVNEIEEAIPQLCRDPKDDYLLAYATVAAADFLVTGDADLLVLDQVGRTRIVSPTAFLILLDEQK